MLREKAIEEKMRDLDEDMDALDIPERMRPGIRAYIQLGRLPGSFLQAVFANNLCEATRRADGENIHLLHKYAALLYNFIPAGAWGNYDKVKSWTGLEPGEGV